MADTEAEVVIKAERHNSKADLSEGKHILEKGVDQYVIEDAEQESDYDSQSLWFRALMIIFNIFVMNQLVYTDSSVLEDIADKQGANKIYTRETNSEIIEDASRVDSSISLLIFVLLTTSGLVIGILFDGIIALIIGSLTFTLGMIWPISRLRERESNREDNNRDQKIADKIATAAENGGRVVAILGNKHCHQVKKRLPNEIEPNFYDTSYSRYHPRRILDDLRSIVVIASLYTILYIIVIFVLTAVSNFL